MQIHDLKSRPPRCAGRWYPYEKQSHGYVNNQISSAVISPHAGFFYSGTVSLEAASYVKKNRLWIFAASHYELPQNGISVYNGDYSTSIGKAVFPQDLSDKEYSIVKKYLSDEGHRTGEHSIENVLFCINHFEAEVKAFCGLVRIYDEEEFETISDDIAEAWRKDDSIVISTDWNHFVSTEIISSLQKEASAFLAKGNIHGLYQMCKEGKQEACGIDGLYLAYKVLTKVNENMKFKVLTATDSTKAGGGYSSMISEECVGYISARN